MYENYLVHHGIKGMRWGHRKQYVKTGYGVRRRVRTDSKGPKSASEVQRARRKQIAKRVAIGAGVTAGILGAAYAVNRVKENRKKEISAFENVLKNTVSSTKPMDRKEKNTYKKIQENWSGYTDKQKLALSRNSHYSNFNRAKSFQKVANNPKISSISKSPSKPVRVIRNGKQYEYNSLDDYTQELLKKNGRKLSNYSYRDLSKLDLY